MNARTRQLLDEVLELSAEDRALIASELEASLEDEQVSPAEIEAAWAEEIARRAKEVLEGRSKGRPAEEVFRDLEARLKSRPR